MFEDQVDGKDVHVLENSSNPDSSSHRQISERIIRLKCGPLSFHDSHNSFVQNVLFANLSLSWGSDPRGMAALSKESAILRAGSSFWLLGM